MQESFVELHPTCTTLFVVQVNSKKEKRRKKLFLLIIDFKLIILLNIKNTDEIIN